MAGMTFRRVLKTRRGEVPAILLVHMDSVQASDTKEYADAVERELKKQPGFERIGERASMVGGKPALVREYMAALHQTEGAKPSTPRSFGVVAADLT